MQVHIQLQSSFEKIFTALLMLVAFLLPLDRKLIPAVAILASVAWIFQGNLKHKLSAIGSHPVFILSIAFYLFHLAGMLYTENVKTGLSHLEVKFSLLLFPVLLAGTRNLIVKDFKKIIWAFVFGNLTAALICVAYAAYRMIKTGENYFYYYDFSIFSLPTYSSVYILFSIAAIFYFITEPNSHYGTKMKWLLVICILFFACIVFLNDSRAAIISGITASALTAVFYFVKRKKWLWLFVSVFLPVLIGTTLFTYNLRFEPIRRFIAAPHDSLPTSSADNITIRYMVAEQSLSLIKENFWLGTGTGDVKDNLMSKYSSLHIITAEHEKLNAHNQFLETFIGLGVAGFLLLLLLVFQPLYSGTKENNILKISFALLIAVNFLFESMLNTEAGAVFFAFFITLLAAGFPQAVTLKKSIMD